MCDCIYHNLLLGPHMIRSLMSKNICMNINSEYTTKLNMNYCMGCGNRGHNVTDCENVNSSYIRVYNRNQEQPIRKKLKEIPELLMYKETMGFYVCKLCHCPFSKKNKCIEHLQSFCMGLHNKTIN